MILFINGFVPQHFAAHEITTRNASCYGSAATTAARSRVGAAAKGAYCLSLSFQKDKRGNVYQPDRSVTTKMPQHKGEAFDYWKGITQQVSNGFRDNRLFFINGSSDNRTTGVQRFDMGLRIGQQLLQKWKKHDAEQLKFHQELKKIKGLQDRVGRELGNANDISQPLLEYFNVSRQRLEQQIELNEKDFVLSKSETLKIIGHSMGAAMAAGLATAVADDRTYRDRIEVVWYLAPHQPHEIKHPVGIVGFQSSSQSDIVASINELKIKAPNFYRRIVDGDSNANIELGVSLEWAKGQTAYARIPNVQYFIENKTFENDKLLGGHAVTSYDDEIDQFFRMYASKN